MTIDEMKNKIRDRLADIRDELGRVNHETWLELRGEIDGLEWVLDMLASLDVKVVKSIRGLSTNLTLEEYDEVSPEILNIIINNLI